VAAGATDALVRGTDSGIRHELPTGDGIAFQIWDDGPMLPQKTGPVTTKQPIDFEW